MKKILALALAAAMVFSVAACSRKTDDTANTNKETKTETTEQTDKKETLIMGTNATFPPYEYYENDTIVGIDADITAAIAEKLGMDFKIEDMEFDSIIPAVQSGKVTMGMAGMTITEDRLASVDFTEPYTTSVQAIIVKEDSPIASSDDLFAGNVTVGVQTGTTGDIYTTGDIEDAGKGTVERYNKGADAVQALLTGKIDCVVIDNEPAKAFVAANEGLKILDTEYATEEYAICMAKGSPLYDDVNNALKELIADGTVQSIIDKYIKAE